MIISTKAIATHTLVLVIMMGMFAFVAFLAYANWNETITPIMESYACEFKFRRYCTDWEANNFNTVPWNWNDEEPTSCDDFGITKPTSKDECQK